MSKAQSGAEFAMIFLLLSVVTIPTVIIFGEYARQTGEQIEVTQTDRFFKGLVHNSEVFNSYRVPKAFFLDVA